VTGGKAQGPRSGLRLVRDSEEAGGGQGEPGKQKKRGHVAKGILEERTNEIRTGENSANKGGFVAAASFARVAAATVFNFPMQLIC